MAVSADDPRAPYQQVADDLRAQIASGDLAPGQRLPSGRDLARRYGVALMTVQKALGVLADAGILVARQGRGTFVAARPEADPPPATPSPEYAEITRRLADLRELVEHTAARLDERLNALEQAAGVTTPPQRPRRPPR